MFEPKFTLKSDSFFNLFFNIQLPKVTQPKFDRLYVFGDSLSDNGNELIGLNYIQENLNSDIEIDTPSPPYFPGRESNGFIWTDYLAQKLDFDLTPVLEFARKQPVTENSNDGYEIIPSFRGKTAAQSTNFAVSGARLVNDDVDPGDLISPSVSTQVDWFLEDLKVKQMKASENGLYVIQGGANDYLSGELSEPTEAVAVVEYAITDLYDAGGRYFLVPNLPDLANTPIGRSFSDEESAFLTDVSNRHNDLLETTLRKLERDLPDIEIESLDFRALSLDIANDPEAFGLTNGTDAYLVGEAPDFSTAGGNPNDYFFFDYIHPTTKGQELLADVAMEAIHDLGMGTEEPDSIGDIFNNDIFNNILGNLNSCNYTQFEFSGISRELFM
ncbi:outer membrane autotransporter barrel domain protein [Calothrix parasitica NIES-267]|uniref:Outer membrane autotransporter barrel domain protein n=1 Tax=Calothrix parasitica NIES-267 TaxID=1973488 RepID=A0A1Z4M108_9CYAN|nr:outer membrane autotransporter barrel domain protein [Calothrix parasitica NIES-267]